MGVNLGEPADLLRVFGRRCVARWRYAGDHEGLDQHMSMGWLVDGRWWADTTVIPNGHGGRIFPIGDDASARAYCAAMMARCGPPERWQEVWPEHTPGIVPAQRVDPPPYPPGDPRGTTSS